MNILFITHYSSLYGANRSLLALLDNLNPEQFTAHVILPHKGGMEKELKKRDIPYLIFPFKNWMASTRIKAPLRLIMNLLSLPILIWRVNSWKIDLVHTNSSVTPIGAWIAFLSGLPHIWHIREFGWEDYQLKYDLGRGQFEYWLNKADHIITVSEAIQKKVLKRISTPSSIIYNGVISQEEADNLPQNRSHGIDGDTIFGIIGVLRPSKGQEQAIKAFSTVNRNFPKTELWIAGSGNEEYEHYLKNLTIKLNISEQVNFLGYVDDPFKFYSEIDIALVCSKNEGMGRVTAEAMVAGKPIIGLDNAGTSELIDDGQTGLLYDGSVDQLISKMKYGINNDLTDLSQNSRKKGIKEFTTEDYSKRVKDIYKHILDR
jgi:glycosyltransferase involved in cell wall biosynthesis